MITELQNFRAKYPDYNDISDGELASKLATKYPDAYGDLPGKLEATPTPESPPAQPEPSTPEWAGKHPNLYGTYGALTETPKVIGEFFGAEKITQPIAQIAAHTLAKSNAERAGIGTPTAGELANAALNTGALLLPYGKVAGGVANVAGKVLPKAAAKIAGAMGAGATGGYMVEAGGKLAEGEAPTPGLTTALGAVIPGAISSAGAIKKGVSSLAKAEAPRIINSLIKPLKKDFSYGKNPGRVLTEEKIIANSFDDYVSKISDKRVEIGERLGNVSSTLSGSGVTVDLSSKLAPIDEAISKAAKMPRDNASIIRRLQNLKDDLLGMVKDETLGHEVPTRQLDGITFNDALELKRLIGDTTKWTGNPSEDEPVNAALRKVWGGIKGELNKQAAKANPKLATEYIKLNEKYADITSAEIAAKYRDKIIERADILSLKGHVGALGAGITTAIMTGGATVPALVAGATGALLDKALGSTAVKTRVAVWLARTSPEKLNIIYRKAPALATAIDKAFGGGTRSPGDIAFQGRNMKSYAMKDLRGAGETLRDTTLTGQSSVFQPRLAKSLLTRVRHPSSSMTDREAADLISQMRRENAVEAFKNVVPGSSARESVDTLVKAVDIYPPQGFNTKMLPPGRFVSAPGRFEAQGAYSKQIILSPGEQNLLGRTYPNKQIAIKAVEVLQRKGMNVAVLREPTKEGMWKITKLADEAGLPTSKDLGEKVKFPWSAFDDSLPISTASVKGAKNISAREMVDALISSNKKSGVESTKILNSIPVYGKTVVSLTPSHEATIAAMREEISQGMAGRRIPVKDADGYTTKVIAEPSTFPSYFQNKKLLKEDTLSAIDKVLKGEPVTKQQWGLVSQLDSEYRKSLVPRALKLRAESKSGFPWEKPGWNEGVKEEGVNYGADTAGRMGTSERAIPPTPGKIDFVRDDISGIGHKSAQPDREVRAVYKHPNGEVSEVKATFKYLPEYIATAKKDGYEFLGYKDQYLDRATGAIGFHDGSPLKQLQSKAPTSPTVVPEAKVDTEALTIPNDLTITATQFLENGQTVKNTKANAKESLKEVDDSIAKTKSILDKLKD